MIEVSLRDDITYLALADGKVNALSLDMLQQLHRQLEEARDSDSRAVVLTGQGRAFSAGVDLKSILAMSLNDMQTYMNVLNDVLDDLFAFPKPVIAAVNGHALAGGIVLTCAADYAIVQDGHAKLGAAEFAVGVPFPAAPLEIISFATGGREGRRVINLAEFFSPAEALDLGLVDEVAAPGTFAKRVHTVAQQMARVPTESFVWAKRYLRQDAIDRIARGRTEMDPQVTDMWVSDAIKSRITAYLEGLKAGQ